MSRLSHKQKLYIIVGIAAVAVVLQYLLHLKLYEYFRNFPPKTIKRHRTYLIQDFHELNELKAYLNQSPNSILYKKWLLFMKKWNNKS